MERGRAVVGVRGGTGLRASSAMAGGGGGRRRDGAEAVGGEAVERGVFFTEEPLDRGAGVELSEEDARHIGVLRLGPGERVGLRDGRGTVASGVLVRVTRKRARVEVDAVGQQEPEPAVHLLVPVADRDRMLWLAEKTTELNVTSWRPVVWHRSRSVSPRGEGPSFRAKVRLRTIAALLQSRSAWLPSLYPEASPEQALAALPEGRRLLMQREVGSIASIELAPPVILAVGPEGGLEEREVAMLRECCFLPVSLGDSILRFETAAVAGVAVARAMLGRHLPSET